MKVVKILVPIFWILFSVSVFSQEENPLEEEQKEKEIEILGTIKLDDIDQIISGFRYHPDTNTYVYTKQIGGFDIERPLVLTRKQYEDLLLRKSLRDNFRKRMALANNQLTEEEKMELLPFHYRVNNKLFELIFGGNEIKVKPVGAVEVDLGIRYSHQDNPFISPRNRTSFAMDFNPRISVGLQGNIGKNFDVNINYDTQATFGFLQQLAKLRYEPNEDDIVQALELGNVSMPINNSLVRGSQNLFGVKTKLQFGATTITAVASRQNSERKTVVAEGGGTVQDFQLFAMDYDEDRHFFLSQYFRNKYDDALKNYPYIDSRVNITRVEVWITNRRTQAATTNNNFRNIIALQDLGETTLHNVPNDRVIGLDLATHTDFLQTPADTPPNNANNKFNPDNIGSNYLNEAVRKVTTAINGFNIPVVEGKDFVKLENARKLTDNEFKFHPKLGYISLQQKLSNDEVLAVAYEYTIGDKVYRVGEFGTDGVDATVVGQDANGVDIPTTQSLVLKMLKSALTSTDEPVWDLMMKNIYSIPNAMQLSEEGFRLNILYTDPQPLNYIKSVTVSPLPQGVANTPLLNVFDLDRLNSTNDPQQGGDGYFDFVTSSQSIPTNANQSGGYGGQNQPSANKLDAITVDPHNGRIIFTTVEPFGKNLFKKLSENPSENYELASTYNDNQKKYVFQSLYRKNKARALQESEKNKFQIKGRFKSANGDGIAIGATNIPQGGVSVSSNGRQLVEGQDYAVDYQMGRVRILDPSLANAPIEISVENNTIIQQKQRTFLGVDVEHKLSEKFKLGATLLNLSEKPLTVKSNYGDESVNNMIMGANFNYSSEVPFLTRWVNKLPFVDTDAPSSIALKGEFAYLLPDASYVDRLNNEATSFIDNFEGTQSNMDILSPASWRLSSAPVGLGAEKSGLESGYNRAKLSWYMIDPVFYSQSQRPDGITDTELSSNRTRRVFKEELFPNLDVANGELLVINTLDLHYNPLERGPYNFNPQYLANNYALPNPQNNWAGIMRSIASTNFEQANVEYIEFWMMDPYVGNTGDMSAETNVGELHFNFGYISEDILADGMKQYENGLPGADNKTPTISSDWGKVPAETALVYAFDENPENRKHQDVGLDGLNDIDEAAKFPAYASVPDPAADNYQYFLNASGDIINRYKNYNNPQGNTPADYSDANRGSQTTPDVEDIDGDNTMNTINAYYDFKVHIKPNPIVGENYVVDVRDTQAELQNGNKTPVRWVQYKVPITALPQNAVGAISDLQSVRFMRMYLTGFAQPLTLRFGSLDLVRSNWRRNDRNLVEDNATIVQGTNTGFDVQSVNIIDNYARSPIPYVLPPGIIRERVNQNNTIININEQALSLKVYQLNKSVATPAGLEPEDARAVFKNVSVDMRRYNKLRMFLHAEALQPPTDADRLKDDEMVGFIRFGNDFTDNYYQVEIPLKVTEWGQSIPEQVWRPENEIELQLKLLTQLKILRSSDHSYDITKTYYKNEEELDPTAISKPNKLRIGVKGNPNFGMVRTIMVGVKNNTKQLYANTPQQPRDLQGEVWFNELRVSDMDNQGGWAATGVVDTRIADIASVSASVQKSTIGFGSLEQDPQERSKEDILVYNISTAVATDKLLPKKWNLNIPFSYTVSEEIITPEFDPNNPDVKLKTVMDYATDENKNKIRERAIDYTKRTSINFIGVKKNRGENAKEYFFDIENFTFSHSFNKVVHTDFEIENLVDKQVRSSVDYSYGFKGWALEPFKNIKSLRSNNYTKWIADININPFPTNVTFNGNIIRQFNQQKFRTIEEVSQGIDIGPLYRRNYFFNYNYGLNFQLMPSLSATYSVNNNNLVRDYLSQDGRVNPHNDIWDNYFSIGIPNTHNQQLSANYELPLHHLPIFSFLKASYGYTSNFSWQRASDAFSSILYNGVNYHLGNTVQNANTHRINASLSMDRLYKYIGLEKLSLKSTPKKPAPKPTFKPGERISNQQQENKPTDQEQQEEESQTLTHIANAGIDLITMLKNVKLIYSETNGTMLPGYIPTVGFFALDKPTVGFVFGSQEDIRYEAAKNGYLTTYPEFNQQFMQSTTKKLDLSAELKPFNDFTINVTANRQYSNNKTEQYEVINGQYNPLSPFEYGNFSISTLMIGNTFANPDQVFTTFRNNRLQVANQLATKRGIDLNNAANIDPHGYPMGYGRSSQEVIIPAFVSAYTGTSVGQQNGFFKNIPMPNWNLTYRGLVRLGIIKEHFKRFSIQHGYRSLMTINSFQTNYEYNANPNALTKAGNFISQYIVGNVNMMEQFSPLIKLDFETKQNLSFSAKIDKERTLSLSFDNNLLTEMTGTTYTFGTGFVIKDIGFDVDFEGVGDNGRIVSDINVKAEFNWRKNKIIVRYLDYDNTTLGGGMDTWTLKLTADYNFTKNFTAVFFYEHNFSKPVISTTYPMTNIRSGFTLRYKFD